MSALPATVDAVAAAEILNCKQSTIEELANRGELPGAKIGKSWVFRSDLLMEWLGSRIEQEMTARKEKPVHQKSGRKKAPPSLDY